MRCSYMVCTITKIDIKSQGRKWKWLWLMYVNGVDLNYHCQQCLLGVKSRKMRDVLRFGDGENIRLKQLIAKFQRAKLQLFPNIKVGSIKLK